MDLLSILVDGSEKGYTAQSRRLGSDDDEQEEAKRGDR
jgi:hypothetical protein